MCSKLNPPATGTGTRLNVVDVVPSCPDQFEPQQYAALPIVSPQVCVLPIASSRNVRPPETGTGVEEEFVVPLPNCPYPFSPQQYAAPVFRTPQVCQAPAAKDTKPNPPPTATREPRP